MSTRVVPSDLLTPVDGGDLHALTWGSGPDVLVALHGITASAVSIQPLGDRLAARYFVVAPDLRGRGASARLPGPHGMKAHVADIIAILDRLGVERATVVGESMGAYAAVQFAISHPERLERLVLVDGGLPLSLPEALLADPDVAVATILGPSLVRLRMTFESRKSHRAFWREHPALTEVWNPYIEEYVDADLTGEPPNLRSVVSEDAVIADGRDQLVNEDLRRLEDIDCPVTFVRAGRNLMNEPNPLFGDDVIAESRVVMPQLVDVDASGFNHYSIMLTDAGADVIAAAVLAQAQAAA